MHDLPVPPPFAAELRSVNQDLIAKRPGFSHGTFSVKVIVGDGCPEGFSVGGESPSIDARDGKAIRNESLRDDPLNNLIPICPNEPEGFFEFPLVSLREGADEGGIAATKHAH
jgi:hypothetical protein